MKAHLHPSFTKNIFAFLLLILCTSLNSFGALNGLTYTINPGNPATTGNYQSIASAVSDLLSGTRADGGTPNGAGVSGPVKITVTSATYSYTGILDITAITGASATNTITIDGGSALTSTLNGNNSTSGSCFGLRLNSSNFITIKNFTVQCTYTGSSFYGIQIYAPGSGSPCTNDSIVNCIVTLASFTAAPGSNNTWAGIVASGSSAINSPATAGYFSNIVVSGCKVNNGHWGIYVFGSGAAPSGITIQNNTLGTYAQYGIAAQSIVAPKIRNNAMGSSASTVVRSLVLTSVTSNGTTDFTEISGNTVTAFTQYGIYLLTSCTANATQPTRIFNNSVYDNVPSGLACRGIYITTSSNYINVWNNSVAISATATGAGNGCLVTDGTVSYIDIRNNILDYFATSGSPIPFYSQGSASVLQSNGTGTSPTTFDYNVFFNAVSGGGLVCFSSGSTCSGSSSPAVSGTNANSIVADPHFKNLTLGSSNLHITALPGTTCLRGTNTTMPVVSNDIDGQARYSLPNFGADEISITTLTTSPVCSGASDGLSASPATVGAVTSFSGGYTWTPGGSGSPITVNPTVNTTYVVTGNDGTCSTAGWGTAVIAITTSGCGSNIVSSTGANGSIGPSGSTTVSNGGNQTYTFTPNSCYSVTGITVDGSAVAPAGSYTFTNVTTSHTISVSFGINTYAITTSAGANGSISTANPVVNCGSDQLFNFTPASCYSVTGLTVDGSAITPASSYTFNNVTSTHSISVTFGYVPLTVSATPSPAIVCPGGNTITATGAGVSGTYAWSPLTGLSASTGASVTASSSVTTTYTITGTSSGGCTGTATVITSPATPLNGIYFIDASASGSQLYINGGQYFTDFASALAALSCAGISGPVYFHVAAGTYTGIVDIPTITGASLTNRLTFDGGNATTCIVQGNNNASGSCFGIRLNSSSFITIKNFTVQSTYTGSSFYGIQVYGSSAGTPCTNDSIVNCIVTLASFTAAPGALDTWAGIVVSGSSASNSPATTGYFSNIVVSGCKVNNGHWGIYAFGSGAAPSGIIIQNNTLSTYAQYGIAAQSIVAPKIRNNTMGSSASTVVRSLVLTSVTSNGTTDFTEISGNTVTAFTQYGIYLLTSCTANATQPTRIFNNSVYDNVPSGLACRGIYITTSSNYINVWNNSVAISATATGAGNGCLVTDGTVSYIDIRNNILDYFATSGSPIPFYSQGSASVLQSNGTGVSPTTFDYNIFFNAVPGGGRVCFSSGSTCSGSSSPAISGTNANSIVADPHFTLLTLGSPDLHITQQCYRGTNTTLSTVPNDLDGQARANPPNIGMDEIPTNTSTISVSSPSAPTAICSGNSVSLSASCSVNCTGIIYTWSPSAGLSGTTGGSVTASSSIAGTYTYTVTGTNSFGCTASANSVAITVNANPTPTITETDNSGLADNDAIICNLDNATLTANPSGLTYSWNQGLGSTQVVTDNPSATTNYAVTVTDGNNCTATANKMVTVNQLPPLVVTPNNAVCTGGTTAALTASGASTYSWLPITNLTPTNGTSATETAQISALTIYTITGTDANKCSVQTQVPVATVAVGGTISAPFTIICSGGTKLLTVGGAAGNDYQWQISADNSTWTIITGATNTTYTTASVDGNTNKFYRLLANSNACWNVASTTAEVDVSNPTIAVTASSITDNTLILNWSPTGTGNYNIIYSGASSGLLTGVTPPKTITGLTADGGYTIVVTQTGLTGCSATGTVSATTLCAVPTNLTATPLTVGPIQELNVSWNGPAGNYRVYYRPLYSAVTFFTKDVSNATSVVLTKQGSNNLYASNTYQIYVASLDCPNPSNIGQPTSSIYVCTLPNPVPTCASPTITSVTSACPVLLEVQLSGGSGSYNVYIQRLTPTLQAVNSYGISSNDFVINAAAGQQYLISADSRCGSVVSTLNIWPGTVTVKPVCNAPANLVLSNPTCHGFTASWNADQCISNTVSGYDLYMRQAGSINYNSYGVPLPGAGIGPHQLVNWLGAGKNMQVFVQSVYSCGGAVTYGPSSQTVTITTQSAGCRDEEPTGQPEENKPAVQQYSADNQEVFSLYPNPNKGEFTVDLSRLSNNTDEVRIEVINMIGQTLITHIASISDGHMSEFINLPSGIAAGTYIVRLTAGKNVYTAKMNVSK